MNRLINEYKGPLASLAFALGLLLPGAASASEDFFAGVKYFKNAQYNEAIASFSLAQQQGLTSPILIYNLGVSHYKLEQYVKAKHYFQQLSGSTKLAPIAHYNLGLIAHKQDLQAQAINWFEQAERQRDNLQIQQLAKQQLTKLGQNNRPSPVTGFIGLTLASEDNVTLINEDTSPSPSESDYHWELYSSLNYQINGTKRKGNYVKLAVGGIRYDQFRSYNQDLINTGAYHSFKLKGLQSQLGIHYYHSSANQQSYQQKVNLQARTTIRLAPKNLLKLRYDLSWIDNLEPSTAYLAGWRHRIRVEHTQHRKNLRLKLRYVLELNDRDDKKMAGQFTSYSPTRHTVRLTGKHKINRHWHQQLALEYRLSRFVSEINNNTVLPATQEQRSRIVYSLTYNIKHNTDLELSLHRTHHHSNDASSNYQNNEARLAINLYF